MLDRLRFLALAAMLLFSPPRADASTLVKIVPSSVSAGIGDTVVVEVRVEDVEALFGVNVDIRYDPLLVEGLFSQEGAFLQNDGVQTSFLSHVDHARGLINFGATRLGEAGGVSGSGTVAEIHLRTLSAGTTPLSFDGIQLFRYPALGEIPHTVEPSEIVISGANRAPELSAIPDTTAVQNIPFGMQIEATDRDDDALVFADDSNLFDISPTGLIAFTPEGADVDSYTITITVTDDSAASASGSFVLTVLPRPRIAINEVLCDPPLGDEGDANRDGVRNGSEDEFVELMNLESVSVDLSGWTLSDGASSPFVFPSGTRIAPGEHLVLFGGGAPTGFSGQVFTDDGTLGGGLTNSGDTIYLINPAGPDTIADLTYTGWGTDQSYTRHPEGAGDFVPHTSLPGRGRFSPGSARPALTAITVLPAGITITMGAKEPFTAFGNFSDGGTEDITAQVSWSASDAGVAVVSSDGVVYAEGPGSTEVQATFGGISGSGTVTVESPSPPVLSDIPDQSIREGEHFEKIFLDLYVNDEDHGDSDLTWTYSGNEALSVNVSSERVATMIASSADWNGSETITFTVTDPDGHGANDAMTATVSGVNDPPMLEAIADTATMVGRWFRLQVFADDPDVVYGDMLSYADDSELFDISPTGLIAFTPEEADVGSHTIPITVTDESAASASGSFVLTVLPRPRIVINEVLCDPPSDGDANRDGAVDPYQDEFIELLNVGIDSVDIGNWRLSDDDVSSASQFVFPPGTHVAPGEYVVLFGGGAPAGFAGQVFVDDGRIGNGLTNRGDVIRLIAPDGPDTIAVLTYSDWGSDQSFVRWPEGLGDFVPHASLPGKGRFSPGTARTVLVSITVTPEDAIIVLGKELSFSAMGIFSDGSTQDLTSDVRWSSSDSTVALVHSPGRIVPVSAGGTQIRATFGAVGSLSQTLTVVWPPPVADFSASPTEGLDTLTVAFTDQSAGLIHRVLWDFGVGSPADTTRNPVHTYGAGTFTVRLTVTGPGGTDTETKADLITVLPKPEEPPPEEPPPSEQAPLADFAPSDTLGVEPLTVAFENRSVGPITRHLWDFGDGSPADTTRNPVHTYGVGAFTVRLIVTGPGGTDTETKTNLITVLPKPEEPPPEEPPPEEPPPSEQAPQSNFVASDTLGVEPLTVAFENRSVGAITRYLWDFGDGSPADTTRNPSHIYRVGTFTVRLTVTGPGGNDTAVKVHYIVVEPEPRPPVNLPPVVADIPDQIIAYGERFVPFDLNDYVRDAETSDAGIRWTCSGQVHVLVLIGADHIVNLNTIPADWIGSETIVFTATDAGGLGASDSMRAAIRAPETLKGDVNGDGLLDTTDVARMADFILGYIPLDAHQRTAGDMNADGTIDLLDILETIRRIREEKTRR